MNAPDYLIWLVVPALAVWVVTVIDMATRHGLGPVARGSWIVATTFFFPVALLWYLVRPVGGLDVLRLDAPDPDDPRAMLAAAVDARSRDALEESVYETTLRQMFPGTGQGV